MKNSTLYRANLSRQKISLLKELSEKKSNVSYDNASPEVYVRPTKEQELDALWKNFKIADKTTKSPGVYLVVGFVVGAIAMFLMTALLSFVANSSDRVDNFDKIQKVKIKPETKTDLAIIPSDVKTVAPVAVTTPEPVTPVANTQTYTVKSGDSLEGIVIRFYGRFDNAKIQKVMEANNMTNPNALQIGQQLKIPMN